MPSFKSILSASAVAFVTANAHMIMNTPAPFGSPNSSPLMADGTDFPCKMKADTTTEGTVTPMTIGSTQKLSFNGSAVHGGGSCQVSLTTDNPPKKTSKWMVIHSIEGGCPAKDTAGNKPEQPGDPTKQPSGDTYDYTIPKELKEGKYTLAWTWHNKIGNREMYMNCANIQISGGNGKRDEIYANETFGIPELVARDTSFPDLFVANIPTTDCSTESVQGGDLKYPNPGASKVSFGPGPFKAPSGPKCSGGSSASSGGNASAGAASGGSASGSGSAAPASDASSSGKVDAMASPQSGSASGFSSPSPSTGASAGMEQSQGGSASPSSAPAPAAQAAPAQAEAPAAPAPATQGSTSCTKPGMSICSADKKQIGTCDMDMKVVMIPIPLGTECSDGQIAWPKGGPSPQKRSRIFGRNGGL